MPVKMRGIRQMTSAQMLPRSVPGTGMNGEKAKDRALGAMVFLTRLARPNTPPSSAPLRQPSSTAPMMTGTCRIVALMSGRSISPKGVKASSKIMALSMAQMASG